MGSLGVNKSTFVAGSFCEMKGQPGFLGRKKLPLSFEAWKKARVQGVQNLKLMLSRQLQVKVAF